MAVAKLTSPATWLNGTVAPPSWFTGVQDTLNSLYKYKAHNDGTDSPQRSIWLNGSLLYPQDASWAITLDNSWWTATAGAKALGVSIPLFYMAGSTSVFQKITAIDVRIHQAGASNPSANAYLITGLGGVGGDPSSGANHIATSTLGGVGQTMLSISGLSLGPTSDQCVTMQITSGQSGDIVYGVRVTYDNSLWVPLP